MNVLHERNLFSVLNKFEITEQNKRKFNKWLGFLWIHNFCRSWPFWSLAPDTTKPSCASILLLCYLLLNFI